jgi:predicted GIY-YIG superfamily endonuclease
MNIPNNLNVHEDLDNYIVYLLVNTDKYNNCTYIGMTNNPDRRLRQHNGDIKGGAKYTHCKKGNGRWEYYGFILGLNKSLALSIEKKIHIYSRKTYGNTPLEKRLNCINNILKKFNEENNDYIQFIKI